jgi:hypothetical protein
MALRVYIDGYLERRTLSRKVGIEVTRELNGYTSRAKFQQVLDAEDERPTVGQHVVIRDDRNLLRNSNRLAESNWTLTDVSTPVATWGAMPEHVGGNGLRWTVAETEAAGTISNRTYLVEHPLDAFGDPTGAVEARYFVASLFLRKESTPGSDVAITATANNGLASSSTTINVNSFTGAYSVGSGTGAVYVDGTDPDWWRFGVGLTLSPATATAMPYVELSLAPGADAGTCCWAIAELAELPDEAAYSWAEADFAWEDASMAWDEYPARELFVPAYVERYSVSANEFLGIVAEVNATWPRTQASCHVDVFAVDYRQKMRRTLVSETFSSQTDQAVVSALLTEYAPYLTPRFTSAAVSSLNFTWNKRPLDQCLDDISAQTGYPWRIHPEALCEIGAPKDEALPFTFGDAHNLLGASARLTDLDWWDLEGAVTVTEQTEARPRGFAGRTHLVEDASAAAVGGVSQTVQASALVHAGACTLAETRPFTAMLLVKQGTGICTVELKDDLSGLQAVRVNLATGELSSGGTAPMETDGDSNTWYRLELALTASVGASEVTLAIYPAKYAAVTGGSEDATLTGEVTVANAQLCAAATLTRFVETEGYRAYPHDARSWTMSSFGSSSGDLANVVTVQSNETGEFTATETDEDSVALYGSWESVLTESDLTSNSECLNRARTEIAQKAYPRTAIALESWDRDNLDVGGFAVATNRYVTQHQAVGQIIQRVSFTYFDAKRSRHKIECAAFDNRRITKAVQKSLAVPPGVITGTYTGGGGGGSDPGEGETSIDAMDAEYLEFREDWMRWESSRFPNTMVSSEGTYEAYLWDSNPDEPEMWASITTPNLDDFVFVLLDVEGGAKAANIWPKNAFGPLYPRYFEISVVYLQVTTTNRVDRIGVFSSPYSIDPSNFVGLEYDSASGVGWRLCIRRAGSSVYSSQILAATDEETLHVKIWGSASTINASIVTHSGTSGSGALTGTWPQFGQGTGGVNPFVGIEHGQRVAGDPADLCEARHTGLRCRVKLTAGT